LRVDEQQTEDVEHEQRHGVALPALLARRIDAQQPIQQPFDRPEHLLCNRRRTFVDPRHVRAERDRERDQHDPVHDDLSDAGAGHWSFSG
jgi:hypothetical protein